ncbi:serpin B9-like protein, partial [Leptotrombidium deliense]
MDKEGRPVFLQGSHIWESRWGGGQVRALTSFLAPEAAACPVWTVNRECSGKCLCARRYALKSECEPVILVFQVENNLTFEKFIAWTKPGCMRNIKVEVFLPRFKLQGDYDMKSVLQRLGMVDAFQQGQADLSAMSTETDLCLSKFVHKSVVEVNEEGTEAAAASGAIIVALCTSA